MASSAAHTHRLALAVALSVAALTVGCGGDAPGPAVSSDEAEIRDATVALYVAIARGDGPKACGLMSPAGRAGTLRLASRPSARALSGRATPPTSCEEVIQRQGEDLRADGMAPEFAGARVQSVDIIDDQATVRVALGRRQRALALRRLAGKWRVDGEAH